jgi:hypothetical protein
MHFDICRWKFGVLSWFRSSALLRLVFPFHATRRPVWLDIQRSGIVAFPGFRQGADLKSDYDSPRVQAAYCLNPPMDDLFLMEMISRRRHISAVYSIASLHPAFPGDNLRGDNPLHLSV